MHFAVKIDDDIGAAVAPCEVVALRLKRLHEGGWLKSVDERRGKKARRFAMTELRSDATVPLDQGEKAAARIDSVE